MGGSRSSSKRKSSKRKSSKISSEARRKKRSRRTKSRKLNRRDDSSSYSNDDSRSSVPISSSSSEDEYSRARSRTRSEVKGSRKRTRRSSSSRGSSKDSRHVKKKKVSKRRANSETRKKSQKKKRRREPSVSSVSCSTCRGGGSGSGESEFERPRRRSREKSKDKRASGKAKSGTKTNKNRSRSCSSCSRNSDSGCGSKDILPVENSSRRLRSVITVAKSLEPEVEEKEWDNDGHKEEIVYDRDDCPSCRSNDSNDGGSKWELAHHSPVDLERWVEDGKGEEALVSDSKMTKLTKSGEGGAQDCQSNSHSDGAGANNSSKEKEREVFPSLSSSNGNDLESILRLKALENLKKYRGGLQTNVKPQPDEKSKSYSDVKQLSTANVEFVQNRSPKEDVSRVVDATKVLDPNPRPTMETDSSHPATSYVKVQEGKGSGSVTESVSARQSVVCAPNQVAISGNSKEEELSPAGAVTSKSEPGKSALRQESSGTILKQTHKANMLVTDTNANKSSAEISEIVGQISNHNDVGVNNVSESSTSVPSSLKPTLEEHSLKEQQGQDKEGSQFEQKTMSVMRGGEMVQVSYKVYIPKKAPALARRHLRR